MDGSPCNNGEAYCYSGECKTYDAQCQTHFLTSELIIAHKGTTLQCNFLYIQTKVLMNVSMRMHKEASLETVAQMELTSFHAKPGICTHSAIVIIIDSHCNSLHTCSDVMCGMIHCSPGDYQYVVSGVSILTVSAYVPSLQQYKECK